MANSKKSCRVDAIQTAANDAAQAAGVTNTIAPSGANVKSRSGAPPGDCVGEASAKIHPRLAQRCLKLRIARAYRVWLLARAINDGGSGRVRRAELKAAITKYGWRGLSRTTLAHILRKGEGIFWRGYRRDGEPWLKLCGLAQVCLTIGINRNRLAYDPLEMPLHWGKTLAGFRAIAYASMHPIATDEEPFGNPISRATLEESVGFSRQTLYRWEQLLGDRIQKRTNAYQNRRWNPEKDLPANSYVDYVGNKLALFTRLPNSYALIGFRRAPRGMIREVNERLGNSPRLDEQQDPGEARRERLFYRRPQAVARRIQQRTEGDWFAFAGSQQTKSGTAIWHAMTYIDRRLWCY